MHARWGVGKKRRVPHQRAIGTLGCRRGGVSPRALFRLEIFDSTSSCSSDSLLCDLIEINEARCSTKLRVNDVACGNSFCVNAAKWKLKPDSLDKLLLAIFSRDVTRPTYPKQPLKIEVF